MSKYKEYFLRKCTITVLAVLKMNTNSSTVTSCDAMVHERTLNANIILEDLFCYLLWKFKMFNHCLQSKY